jgi:hypothetical protein
MGFLTNDQRPTTNWRLATGDYLLIPQLLSDAHSGYPADKSHHG